MTIINIPRDYVKILQGKMLIKHFQEYKDALNKLNFHGNSDPLQAEITVSESYVKSQFQMLFNSKAVKTRC